ncbi:MAG TPA: chemotaxis protein CheX [Polyangiaceae bacterium]|jgi:CheY-specific phosphatase CheX|nr:chemotaxis protein CheX [Polyangiaceae bacterium]
MTRENTSTRGTPQALVLFVAAPNVPPPSLERRGGADFRVVPVTPNEANEMLRTETRLSLVWIDESAGHAGIPLAAALKTMEPELPVVWSGKKITTPPFAKPAPDRLILGKTAWDAAADTVAELVRTSTYDAKLVGDLCGASSDAMARGFHSSVTVANTFFKSTRAPLASVSAAVEFSGPELDASIIVSAESKPLREVLRVSVPESVASLAALHDLAGEIANHIVGRLKATLDPGGVAFDKQSPLVLRGHEANIRAIRGRPSIVARLIAEKVEVFVQLYLKGRVPPRGASKVPPGSVPGELHFLDD